MKSGSQKLLGVLAVAGLSLPWAIEAEEQIDCSMPRSTYEITQCQGRELKQADDQLNETYQELLKTVANMEEDTTRGFLVNKLRESQRAWINYRDKNCDFHARLMGEGTASGTEYGGCEIGMTKERLAEIKQAAEFWRGKGY